MRAMLSLVLVPVLAAQAPQRASLPFRYVAPDASPIGEARLRALPLDDEPPSDVKVQLPASRGKLRYGQLRFGAMAGIRVVIAVDRVPDAEPLLYVDADRDRTLTGAERVHGERGNFLVSLRPRLDTEGREGDARIVHLRFGRITGQLGVAMHGCMEGEVDFAGRRLSARRYDGDGNGLFADPADGLWIDRDGDRREDPVRELFPYRALQSIDGALWVVRGDELGRTVTIEELRDRGTVRFELAGMPKPSAFAATLASDDGVVLGIDAVGTDVVVPVGRYRITNLQLTLPDEARGQPWSYVFAEGDGGSKWTVERDTVVAIAPCASPQFRVTAEPPSPGGGVVARPRFTLGTGLYLVTCFRGDDNHSHGSTGAGVTLLDGSGKLIDSASSGFA